MLRGKAPLGVHVGRVRREDFVGNGRGPRREGGGRLVDSVGMGHSAIGVRGRGAEVAFALQCTPPSRLRHRGNRSSHRFSRTRTATRRGRPPRARRLDFPIPASVPRGYRRRPSMFANHPSRRIRPAGAPLALLAVSLVVALAAGCASRPGKVRSRGAHRRGPSPRIPRGAKVGIRVRSQLSRGGARGGAKPHIGHDARALGGGADGAFGAGLLCGWTEAGNRPSFDIVTGISTGALMAPLVFLGSARDADLRSSTRRRPARTCIDRADSCRLRGAIRS